MTDELNEERPPSNHRSVDSVGHDLRSALEQPQGTGLVFARDYYPLVPFRVLARLPELITVSILDEPSDDVQLISQPDEYNGYVITYAFRETPIFVFLFSRRYLPTGSRYRFGGDTSYFSTNLNLLEASLVNVR